MLLVRFSDIEYAKIKISVKDMHGGKQSALRIQIRIQFHTHRRKHTELLYRVIDLKKSGWNYRVLKNMLL